MLIGGGDWDVGGFWHGIGGGGGNSANDRDGDKEGSCNCFRKKLQGFRGKWSSYPCINELFKLNG